MKKMISMIYGMKVLVYGSRGWIGKQFINLLKQNKVNFIEGRERVDNISELNREIDNVKPTHIISFIGRTHGIYNGKEYSTIDYLEQKGCVKYNVRDNLFSPLILVKLCKDKNIHYTYLGTGCIFKYDNNHPSEKEIDGFNEMSKPNFFGSSYSIVKGYTDQLMNLYKEDVLNLRIRMPITAEDNPRNFITKITNYEKICSMSNSMSVLPDLLPLVIEMMESKQTGTINLTNPGLISHNEILEMYRKYVNPNFVWQNFSINEQNKILDSERSNNYLDTTKLKELFPNVKNIKNSVKNVLQNYKLNAQYDVSKTILNRDISDIQNNTNSTLFITGGCGFIGSNFINYFFTKYDKVNIINFDAMYYCANETNIEKYIRNSDRYKLVKGNLRSIELLKYIFSSNKITHVIHFAAQSHVQNSFNDSLNYTNDNIVGTHNLLEVNRTNIHLKKFIHVSTDEVYGESMLSVDEKHKTEHSVLCPTNPYAATKAGAELLAQSYNHSFSMPIVITRGNNVYGPNQYPEKVIPKFISQLKNNNKITIQGDGSCIRAFLHSSDTSTAFLRILEKGKIGEIYNIGCNEGMEYSIKEVAEILIKMIKNTDEFDKWIEYIEDRPFNDKRYYISNQKLKDLGWNIKVKFIDGLKSLV